MTTTVAGNTGAFHISDDLYRLLDQPPNPLFEPKGALWITPEPEMPVIELAYRFREWAAGLVLGDVLGPPADPPAPIDDGRSVPPALQAFRTPANVAQAVATPVFLSGVSCRGRIHYRDSRPRQHKRPERNDRLGFEHLLMCVDVNRDTPTVKVELDDHLQGGTLEAVAYYFSIRPVPVFTARFRLKVLGRNPAKDVMRNEIAKQAAMAGLQTRVLDLWVICYLESRFRQFVDHGPLKGEPFFGQPEGYGVMQVDPPPTPEVLWNWKENVKAGIGVFQRKLKAATQYLAKLQAKYPGAPPFTAREIRMEVFQRYNGGRFWGFWDGTQWQNDPTNQSNWYGYNAQRIWDLVDNGNSPSDWRA